MNDHYFWKQLTKTSIYGYGLSLAKVLISKTNDTNQTLDLKRLNSSFRPKGLFKTMGLVKRALLTLESKC